jgi:hypothetical protein
MLIPDPNFFPSVYFKKILQFNLTIAEKGDKFHNIEYYVEADPARNCR